MRLLGPYWPPSGGVVASCCPLPPQRPLPDPVAAAQHVRISPAQLMEARARSQRGEVGHRLPNTTFTGFTISFPLSHGGVLRDIVIRCVSVVWARRFCGPTVGACARVVLSCRQAASQDVSRQSRTLVSAAMCWYFPDCLQKVRCVEDGLA